MFYAVWQLQKMEKKNNTLLSQSFELMIYLCDIFVLIDIIHF